jgi:hypothetical protein
MAENTVPGSGLRLATSDGQREPGWRLTPDRRLRLVVSQHQPPDALDRYFASAEQAYPHLRHWVVQIKQAARKRGVPPPSQPPPSLA